LPVKGIPSFSFTRKHGSNSDGNHRVKLAKFLKRTCFGGRLFELKSIYMIIFNSKPDIFGGIHHRFLIGKGFFSDGLAASSAMALSWSKPGTVSMIMKSRVYCAEWELWAD
jgi:hypothetical protein